MRNRYPIFIPTKGRHEHPVTINMFKAHGVDFYIVVEPQERDAYAHLVPADRIIVTPHRDKGLTATRNFIWDLAESWGVERFWTFDDNIGRVYRWNHNKRLQVKDGTYLRVVEDFADRYTNLHVVGMNYVSFCKSRQKIPPFYLNTRVYSNMLLRTDARLSNGDKLRNKLFYNDDTDLCLRVLKDGLPVVQINAFLIDKGTTMHIKGGMTDYYLSEECKGRLAFAEELRDAHPDCVTVTKKFGRWHHHVDYTRFKRNKLVFKQGFELPKGTNEYGLRLVKVNKEEDMDQNKPCMACAGMHVSSAGGLCAACHKRNPNALRDSVVDAIDTAWGEVKAGANTELLIDAVKWALTEPRVQYAAGYKAKGEPMELFTDTDPDLSAIMKIKPDAGEAKGRTPYIVRIVRPKMSEEPTMEPIARWKSKKWQMKPNK